ncbi:MAG: TonB-dependent receptor, partial [Bacteroidales bacterium]|nr:TonB-dependent receptor [Bacteroidales bacterium]
EDTNKVISLFDAGFSYDYGAIRFGLDVRNILNMKSYKYVIFDSVNTYSYDYALRGREIVLSIKYLR